MWIGLGFVVVGVLPSRRHCHGQSAMVCLNGSTPLTSRFCWIRVCLSVCRHQEEEFSTIKENKKARAAYREQLDKLKKLKGVCVCVCVMSFAFVSFCCVCTYLPKPSGTAFILVSPCLTNAWIGLAVAVGKIYLYRLEYVVRPSRTAVQLGSSKEKALQVKSNLLDRFEEWYAANGGGTVQDEEESEMGGADDLDYGEQFEALERERVRNSDPDSLAFFNSRKMMTQTKRLTKTGTQHAMAKKRTMQR